MSLFEYPTKYEDLPEEMRTRKFRFKNLKELLATFDFKGPDFKKNLQWVMEYLETNNESLNTMNNQVTTTRKILKFIYPGEDEVINAIIKMPKEQMDLRFKNQAKALTKALSNKVVISFDKLEKIAEDLESKTDLGSKIILAQLATGRRLIEILKVSNFAPDPEHKNYIIVDKFAKGQTQTNVKVPLNFITYSELDALMHDIRGKVKVGKLDNSQLTNKYIKRVNGKVKKLFPEIASLERKGSHILRKLYAMRACKLFKASHIDDVAYISSILGHESILSSCHYKNFMFGEEVKEIKDNAIPADVPGDMVNLWIEQTRLIKAGVKPTYKRLSDVASARKIRKFKDWLKSSDIQNPVYEGLPENIPQNMFRLYNVYMKMKEDGEKITHRSLKGKKFGGTLVSEFLKIVRE